MATFAQVIALLEGQALFGMYKKRTEPCPKWRDLTDESQRVWQDTAVEFMDATRAPHADMMQAVRELAAQAGPAGTVKHTVDDALPDRVMLKMQNGNVLLVRGNALRVDVIYAHELKGDAS